MFNKIRDFSLSTVDKATRRANTLFTSMKDKKTDEEKKKRGLGFSIFDKEEEKPKVTEPKTYEKAKTMIDKEQQEKDKMQKRADLLYPDKNEENKIDKKPEEKEFDVFAEKEKDVKEKEITENKVEKEEKREEETNELEILFDKNIKAKITSDFGYRKAPKEGASSNHSGIDIQVPEGTPVKSIADGTIVAAREGMRGYGTGVFVDHGIINGKHVISEYGHLSKYDVKIGDKIKKGQIIAKSGNTGVSTGPHLHITVREDKEPVNPRKYFK